MKLIYVFRCNLINETLASNYLNLWKLHKTLSLYWIWVHKVKNYTVKLGLIHSPIHKYVFQVNGLELSTVSQMTLRRNKKMSQAQIYI